MSEENETRGAYIALIETLCNKEFEDHDNLPKEIEHILLPYLKDRHGKDYNVSSEGVGDLSRSFFSDDIPKHIKRIIHKYRKVTFK